MGLTFGNGFTLASEECEEVNEFVGERALIASITY